MKHFIDLERDDQEKCLDRAEEWFQKHPDHVESLLKDRDGEIYPSGSDCGHPELWLPMHWRWFFNQMRQKR